MQALLDQASQIVTILANESQKSSSINTKIDPKEQEDAITLEQLQEVAEEAKAYEKGEESYVEDLKWLIEYFEEKLVSKPPI